MAKKCPVGKRRIGNKCVKKNLGWKKTGANSWTNNKDTNLYIDKTAGCGVDKGQFPRVKYQVLLYPLDDSGGGEGIGSPKNYLTKTRKTALEVANKYMVKNKMVKRKPKCSGIEIKPSKSFEGMYAIHINGKVFDEPHASKIKAMNQIKRFKKSFGCKR